MPELSSLLRQRLQAGEDPRALHPDADTLTAYVELLLPAHERERVVKHLSLCTECREVVALTTPERELAAAPEPVAEPRPAAVALPAPRKRWFLTPGFALAASIAFMVLGITLVLQLPEKHGPQSASSEQKQEAMVAPPPAGNLADKHEESTTPPAAEPQAQPQVRAAAPAPTLAQKRNTAAPAALKAKQPASAETARSAQDATRNAGAPVEIADLRKQDYINSQIFATETSAMMVSSTTAVRELPQAPVPMQQGFAFGSPSVVNGATLTSGNLEIPPGAAATRESTATLDRPDVNPQQGGGLMAKIVELGKRPLGKRAPLIKSSTVKTLAMFNSNLPSQGEALARSRSLDRQAAGALAQSPAFTSRVMAPSMAQGGLFGGVSVQWKVVQGKLLKSADLSHWIDGYPDSQGLEFSVVSANGADVWAGGNKALLVHSQDAGATWRRVMLGAGAAGKIVSIEGGSPGLVIKTSAGQTWSTQDAGQSWALQQ